MTGSSCVPAYLHPSVVAEPLVARWYAWGQLIPPATAALHLAHRQIPVMSSFVSSPMLHEAASQRPELLGGRFMEYPGGRASEVESLLDWTRREQADLIELAGALHDLHEMLRARATGMSLDGLYPMVPAPIRGLVELEYDLYGRPAFRLIEALLYRSRFYRERLQGFALRRLARDERPFMLSTPRLDDPEAVAIEIHFADPAIDALFVAASRPARPDELAERLGVRGQAAWETMFTSQPPPKAEAFRGPGVRVRYLGHAGLVVETADVCVLIDPVVGHPIAAGPDRLSYGDLPDRIDYILITHNHQDHAHLESLLRLRHKTGTLVVAPCIPGALQDPSLKLMFRTIGFPNVLELGELESVEIPGGRILGLPFLGEHHDLAIRSRLGYRIDLLGRSMMALADHCNIEPAVYEQIRSLTGPIGALFLGMECVGSPLTWSYGPLLPERPSRAHDQSRRGRGSNSEEGRALVEATGAEAVYIYAMGLEPWMRHILGLAHSPDSPQILESDRLIAWCREQGIPAERLYAKAEILLA